MYNGIGLTTPRGSGTNGYVQRNMAFMSDKPRVQYQTYEQLQKKAPIHKPPNPEIIEHEKKRQIEVKLMEWASNAGLLDDPNISQETLDATLATQREKIRDEMRDSQVKLNMSESHQRNFQKQKETEKFKAALRLSDDYSEGSAFDRKLQEKKKQDALEAKVRKEVEERLQKEKQEREKRKLEKEKKKEEKEQKAAKKRKHEEPDTKKEHEKKSDEKENDHKDKKHHEDYVENAEIQRAQLRSEMDMERERNRTKKMQVQALETSRDHHSDDEQHQSPSKKPKRHDSDSEEGETRGRSRSPRRDRHRRHDSSSRSRSRSR